MVGMGEVLMLVLVLAEQELELERLVLHVLPCYSWVMRFRGFYVPPMDG